ncbi:C45 family autoproteolytic acyltransferase/hydolase [[Eubacterium] cellulosolvens]
MKLSTRIVSVEGSPSEIGFQYGTQAKDLILRNIETYQTQFKRFAKIDWNKVKEDASNWIPIIRNYDEDIMEEIEGIATGAGRTVEEIVALNARYEFAITPLSGKFYSECTSFAVTPDAKSTNVMILGQNWDFRSKFKETCVLLKIKQNEKKPNIITHVEAGTVGHKGLNSHGLGVCINALLSDRDRVSPGVPLVSVVSRRILNSGTIRDAIYAVAKAKRAASINYMIAHAGGEAVDLEVTPEDIEILHPENGILTHSNNFISLNTNVKDLGKTVFSDSPIRWNRIRRLLMKKKKLNVSAIRNVASDHFDYPNSICRHPDPRLHPDDQFETITSVIMNLKQGRMYMTEGTPCKVPYKPVNAKL